MATLLVTEGPNDGDVYPLGQRTTVIGRQETCPIQIVDERLSRKHMQIRFDDSTNQYHALDMRSANGTMVNGQRIESDTPLRDRDEIRIGVSVLVFLEEDFTDRDTAMRRFKQADQRGRPTIGP